MVAFYVTFVYAAVLKVSIAAETKCWKVLFGRRMNSTFCTTMDGILEQIDEISKQLSRPIKDLDDVRTAMNALKEIRENEIRIDNGSRTN